MWYVTDFWVDPVLATHHGVFVSDRNNRSIGFYVAETVIAGTGESFQDSSLPDGHRNLVTGDRAVELLMKRSLKDGSGSDLKYYDLYSDFGLSLGNHPRITDDELNRLSVAILPLPGGGILPLRAES